MHITVLACKFLFLQNSFAVPRSLNDDFENVKIFVSMMSWFFIAIKNRII